MKIAICFSGQTRTFDQCWSSYQSLLSKHDCDLFGATTPDADLDPYPFTRICRQEDIVMSDPWYNINNHPKSPGQNMLRQFWLVELANTLRIQYEQEQGIRYDFVFRTRFDNEIIGALPDLAQCDPDCVYIPEGHDHPECHPGLGISDRFALGGGRVMTAYCTKISLLDEFMANPDSWYFAEVILKWVLNKNNICIKRFPETVKIRRENGNLV